MYESSYSPFSSNSSSAGAGEKLSSNQIAEDPNFETSSIVGEAMLLSFIIDDIWHYSVYNFTSDSLSDLISLDLSDSYSLNDHTSTSEKGFMINLSSGDENVVFVIGLEGNILFRDTFNDVDSYNLVISSAFVCEVLDEEDNLSEVHLIVYDGTVRRLTFLSNGMDNLSISCETEKDGVNSSGMFFTKETDSIKELYFLKNGEENPTLIYSCDPNELDYYSYALGYSNLLCVVNIDAVDGYIKMAFIYDANGSEIYSYNIEDVSAVLRIGNVSFVGHNGSFSLVGNDEENSLYYIFYYSHLSNTITYQSIGSSIHTKIDTNIGDLRDSSEYINSSHIFIYYQDFDNDGYSGYYSDDAKILAIFDTKESIGDFVQFTSPSDNRSIGFNDNGPFFRGIGPNKIYFLSIMGTPTIQYTRLMIMT